MFAFCVIIFVNVIECKAKIVFPRIQSYYSDHMNSWTQRAQSRATFQCEAATSENVVSIIIRYCCWSIHSISGTYSFAKMRERENVRAASTGRTTKIVSKDRNRSVRQISYHFFVFFIFSMYSFKRDSHKFRKWNNTSSDQINVYTLECRTIEYVGGVHGNGWWSYRLRQL